MPRLPQDTVLAAIDVGTNAVKLELARPLPDGSLESLHQERDPVRPGEGVFKTGRIPREVCDRLLAALRRYGALCRRYKARVRAVATSAVREAKNKDEIIQRARKEAGLNLEIVSGREEARLICLGVLHGKPPDARSLCIDIGGGSTEVATAVGERPVNLWSISLGAVRLAEVFGVNGRVGARELQLMRDHAREAVAASLPGFILGAPRRALGSSGNVKAVVSFAAAEGTAHATARQISRAVEDLVTMGAQERRRLFDSRRADIIVPGAVILEALARHLKLESVTAVDRGLRDGILVELMRRRSPRASDRWLVEAAQELGRRWRHDEAHARQVARLSLELFDQLEEVHGLPDSARPLLEVAALLHDAGNVVSYQKHHRHTYYLITNADIPGLADRERELVAQIARYHRRNLPDLGHPALEGLTRPEAVMVRKLAMLVRLGDALDRSHLQPVRAVRAQVTAAGVALAVEGRGPVDLELWDVQPELPRFRDVFRRRLTVAAAPPRGRSRSRSRARA